MRLGAVLTAVVVLVGGGATLATPATARTRTLVDRGDATAIGTDGGRWLLVSHPGVLTATDTRGGERRSFPLRAPCAVRTARRALALVICPQPNPEVPAGETNDTIGVPFVFDLRTGTVVPVPNAGLSSGTYAQYQDPGWTGIGAQWLSGGISCYHCETAVVYVNWHTGERRESDSFPDDAPRLDVDDPQLRPIDVSRLPPRAPVAEFSGTPLVVSFPDETLVLSSCPGRPCGPVASVPGRYVWVHGAHIHGYDLRTRRRVSWGIPARYRHDAVDLVLNPTRVTARFAAPGAVVGRVLTAAWPR